jgi:ABC-type dipeptide/oligopeptide/nickel transport system ATPase component
VMYAGKIVEFGPAVEIFNSPLHPLPKACSVIALDLFEKSCAIWSPFRPVSSENLRPGVPSQPMQGRSGTVRSLRFSLRTPQAIARCAV